jgi:hypothetical protein
MKRLPILLLTLMAALLVAAPAASASEQAGRAWPGGRITYHTTASAYSASVDKAARIWNRAGVGVKFVKTTRAKAQVVLSYGGRRCEGTAYAGYIGRSQQSPVVLGAGCNKSLIVLTAVHELGHVLGLGHENGRCARMNPDFDGSGTPGKCTRRSLSYWLAHSLVGDDLRGARRIYR